MLRSFFFFSPAAGDSKCGDHHRLSVTDLACTFGFFWQSPDGDVIDCVPAHLQPAFEHPKLRGQKPEVGKAGDPWHER